MPRRIELLAGERAGGVGADIVGQKYVKLTDREPGDDDPSTGNVVDGFLTDSMTDTQADSEFAKLRVTGARIERDGERLRLLAIPYVKPARTTAEPPIVFDTVILSNFAASAWIDWLCARFPNPRTVKTVERELWRGHADELRSPVVLDATVLRRSFGSEWSP